MAEKQEVVEYDIQTIGIRDHKDLRMILATNYHKQLNNLLGDEDKARKFLSSVMNDVQRTPKLLDCTPVSLINSYLMMAELGLMPSGVSGEAYVLPYNDKKNGMQAQFQLGYQGLVTLFYRAGVKEIVAEIVHEKDDFKYENGVVSHIPDVWADDRGEAKGAYVIVTLQTGGKVTKVMSKKEILEIAKKFSKSFSSSFSPWNETQDPQKWMWRKTVLKQAAKLIPKNETIYKAVAADNEDSIINDRLAAAKDESESLTMGALKLPNAKKENDQDQTEAHEAAGGEEVDNEEPPD